MPQEMTEPKAAECHEVDRLSPPPSGECAERIAPVAPVVTAPPRPGRTTWSIAPI